MMIEEMNGLYLSTLYMWPQFFYQKICQRGRLLGIWVGCTIAKQISMIEMLDTMFQHVFGISVRCWI